MWGTTLRTAGVWASQKISNGKKKGKGNTKNGNKYLSWAFVEAANFAIRFSPKIKSFYQRKKSKTKGIVALKAVAHKLCRACYYIMRDRVAFNMTESLRPELSLYGWDGAVSPYWGWLRTTRFDWPLSRPLNRQLGGDLISGYAHAVSQLWVGPRTGRATRFVNPKTLDATWYRQFFRGKLTCQGRERISLLGSLHSLDPDG